jgi:quinoprotein glucose dehydrogenase
LRARGLGLLLLLLAGAARADEGEAGTSAWPSWGNDAGGSRYADLRQIAAENVESLEVAWTYRTGDVSDGKGAAPSKSAFEATPILAEGALVFCTPFNRVVALDPATGAERWSFDPRLDLTARYANQLTCRGVSAWRDANAAPADACATRIFTATNDARLLALDARSGRPCAGFGRGGEVDLNPGVGRQDWRGEYQVTSPPALAGGLVIVGSAVSDNRRVDAPSGVVRAFDARDGRLRWAWDVAPPGPLPAGRAPDSGYALGSPNVWAPMAVDEARDLLFVPTGNPAPDYYGGQRVALERYGSSLVALRASTGAVVWHFQTVHHDLWDFDVPAQPTLTGIRRDGRTIPAVVQATKMGMLFVLERETGAPLFPIAERPVPASDVPGEQAAPTQPFPERPPPLVAHGLPADGGAWGLTPLDRSWCRERLGRLRYEGIYTPPSLGEGSLMYPGNAGGSNWGGVAVDAERGLLVANVMQLPFVVSLFPSAEYESARAQQRHERVEISPQRGTPFALRREPLLSPLGVPCTPPPWGKLVAVDLEAGTIRWDVPLGTLYDVTPVPLPITLGTPNVGGPLLTGSGLLFIGAALDDFLRAFDAATGRELWRGRLPAGGQATPMTYLADGRQFVVIAAGGHGSAGSRLGDFMVAYALPREAD